MYIYVNLLGGNVSLCLQGWAKYANIHAKQDNKEKTKQNKLKKTFQIHLHYFMALICSVVVGFLLLFRQESHFSNWLRRIVTCVNFKIQISCSCLGREENQTANHKQMLGKCGGELSTAGINKSNSRFTIAPGHIFTQLLVMLTYVMPHDILTRNRHSKLIDQLLAIQWFVWNWCVWEKKTR